ncbi:Phytoene desaturase [Dorcoceras hygrometricum]|uniref:Phytoene desaturase n=1 Tax=Dorcoceras hygrometricum TaxID=472368 RepID=A0A2Z7BTD1_9LAMI|nr:Phytoene desaturase [Dorcoceras hygrometricum]
MLIVAQRRLESNAKQQPSSWPVFIQSRHHACNGRPRRASSSATACAEQRYERRNIARPARPRHDNAGASPGGARPRTAATSAAHDAHRRTTAPRKQRKAAAFLLASVHPVAPPCLQRSATSRIQQRNSLRGAALRAAQHRATSAAVMRDHRASPARPAAQHRAMICAGQRPVSRPPACIGRKKIRQSGPRPEKISLRSAYTRRLKDFIANGFSSKSWPEKVRRAAAAAACTGGGVRLEKKGAAAFGSRYGPFNPYIPIRSTTIGKSRVAKDPIAMHTSWRSNSDIASVTSIGYPRMSASGESSTTMHRLLHASGSHPIPPPNDSKTNQYNPDLGLIHSTNGNHSESPNEGSSIDHQVTIYLHAQNITMYPTNETWYFASQILVSSSGGLIPF